MPKIDIGAAPAREGSGYPEPFAAGFAGRLKQALGDAAGLTQFGVNLTTIPPGEGSALRHWHEEQDEFVYVLAGEVVLIEDDGETPLGPGEAAGFKAGVPNGHHLVNRGDEAAIVLEVGTRTDFERSHYPDDDLAATFVDGRIRFSHREGQPYS